MFIQGQNLTKKYRSKTVVDGVNINLNPGKITAILGPNGAGKSTIIKMLTGQIKPNNGVITINEDEYKSFPSYLRPKLGIMPQEIVIWDDLNILENLNYTASLYKMSKDQKKSRIPKIIKDLKLQPELKTLAKNLSGGYKRRLNLAISIVHNPDVIFLDEPTPGIDAQSRILLMEYIEKLATKNNHTIVLTDHYLDQAEKISDYVYIIDNGKIITEGTVSQLKSKHGQGNILQIHLSATSAKDLEKYRKKFSKEFDNPTLHKQTISILIDNIRSNLNKAIKLIDSNKIPIYNLNVKEPTLEDIFILLTGKEVRE